MWISQVFILSPRGDKLVFKDYRQDVAKNADEIFYRIFRFWGTEQAGTTNQAGAQDNNTKLMMSQHHAVAGDCPPFFAERGIFFSFVRRNNLLFVATTTSPAVSPAYMAETLNRTIKVLKDFLGIVTEESVRKNFSMIYEILDECLDGGVVQELNTEKLRPYVFSEPVAVEGSETKQVSDSIFDRIRRGDFGDRTRKATATNVSVVNSSKDRKNEIFVDILERLNCVFSPAGTVVNAEVDGSVILKSFLAGSPDLYLGFNEDLVVGRNDSRSRFSSVVLDSVNFHERADYSRFETDRVLVMKPPDGEFVAMNYRVAGTHLSLPFRLSTGMELLTTYKVELTIRIRADIHSTTCGINVVAKIPLPKTTTSVAVELGIGAKDQKYDYKEAERTVNWLIPKFSGSTEQICKVRVSTSAPITGATRKEFGPIMLNFEVPNYNVSGLGIKLLKLEERSQTYNPQRWVRNIAQANSYAFRVQ